MQALFRSAGTPMGTHPPMHAPPRRRKGRSRLLRLVKVLVVAAVVAGGIVAVRHFFPRQDTGSHPSEWDPRVVDIVEFVELERGLTFEHPVYVDFFSEADFVALAAPPAGEVDDATRERFRQDSALLDAMGLVKDYDALAGTREAQAVTTLGFYSPEVDRLAVRGEELTPPVRLVLAHELTHALQAQYFDLTLGGADDFRRRAVVEADAMRIERAYLATMTPEDQAAATAGTTMTEEQAAQLEGIPWIILDEQYAPYVLGPLLVDRVAATEGDGGVDALLRDLPSEEVLVSSWLHDRGDADRAVELDAPTGVEVLRGPDSLSMLHMLAMLDAWLPWTEARNALAGWDGGSMVLYERDATTCFTARAAFAGGAEVFQSAVTRWAAAAGSTAMPVLDGEFVVFEACERAADAPATPDPAVTPVETAMLEDTLLTSLGGSPSEPVVAGYRCLVGTMVDDPAAGPLLMKPSLTPDEQNVVAWVRAAAAQACGVA